MDANGIQRSMFPSEHLGLDLQHKQPPQHQHHQNQNPYQNQNPHQSQQPQQPQIQFMQYLPTEQPQSSKHPQPQKPNKQKHQLTLSDEDPEDASVGEEKLSPTPWKRMKWTAQMIRLLIMAVHFIEDEWHPSDNNDQSKKKSGGLMQQRKGKWKSVSNAMMDRGFLVSPQQCEDKFNDLNKRYKRVNEILGKGTACDVVANQGLLESMDHVPPKSKDEVRKLLNSKHLFFPEMCAYHNNNFVAAGEEGNSHNGCGNNHHQHKSEGLKVAVNDVNENGHETGIGNDNTNCDDEETEDGNKLRKRKKDENEDKDGDDDVDDDSDKRMNELIAVDWVEDLQNEVKTIFQDGTKSPWERRQWMRNKLLEVEEIKVGYQCRDFSLEKVRRRWIKYCVEKEREMEFKRLENARMKLETDRMLLLLRQKELELMEFHHQQEHPQNNHHQQQEAAINRSNSIPAPK